MPIVSDDRDSGPMSPSSSCSSSRFSVSRSSSCAASRSSDARCLIEQALRLLVGVIGQPCLLRVAQPLRLLGEGVVVGAHRPRGRRLGHAVLEDHRACDLGHLLEVVRRAVGDAPEDDLLGGAAGERHLHHVEELFLRVQVALLQRQVVRVAERVAAPDDRHLLDREQVAHQMCEERVPALVVGEDPLLLLGDDAPLLQAGDDAFHRAFEVLREDRHGAPGGRRRSRPRCRGWRGRRP